MTDPRENEEVVRRLTDAWNERDRETMSGLYAEEFVVEGDQPEVRTNAEQVESEWTFFEAFPDIEATIDELIAEDDSVLVRWTVSGTHDGTFAGVEPTGAHVEYAIWVIYRVVEGELAAMNVQMDLVGLLTQLGAVDWPPE